MDSDLTSVDFLYDFTESSYRAMRESLTGLTNRLAGTVGFAGLMAKLAVDLPAGTAIEQGTRLITLSLLLLSVGLGVWGLMPRATGNIVPPGVLLDEWREEPEERAKLFVIVNWRDALDKLEKLRHLRAKLLHWSMICLVVAILLIGATPLIQASARMLMN